MTLLQLALASLALMLLGTLALALDSSAVLLVADSAAVATARFFLPLWEPLEQAFRF
jgi:hypothetical protein